MADIAKQSVLNKRRVDKFLLSLTVPEGLKQYASRVQRATGVSSYSKVIPNTLQYSVEGTIVPSVNVPASDQGYDRQVMKVSTHSRPAYEDVTVNFKIDNQFNNYWYVRPIGFGMATLVFGIMTWLVLGETPDMRTWISIVLSVEFPSIIICSKFL